MADTADKAPEKNYNCNITRHAEQINTDRTFTDITCSTWGCCVYPCVYWCSCSKRHLFQLQVIQIMCSWRVEKSQIKQNQYDSMWTVRINSPLWTVRTIMNTIKPYCFSLTLFRSSSFWSANSWMCYCDPSDRLDIDLAIQSRLSGSKNLSTLWLCINVQM